jgi:protoheme IX farnesyltransferase
VLALSVLVASASAGAFNQYVEAESDRLMARTRSRAFASGALQRPGLAGADGGMPPGRWATAWW